MSRPDTFNNGTNVVRFEGAKTGYMYVAKIYKGALITLDKTYKNSRGSISKIKLTPGEIEHIRCVKYLEKSGHLPIGSIYG